MKLCTFLTDKMSPPRLGLATPEGVIDVARHLTTDQTISPTPFTNSTGDREAPSLRWADSVQGVLDAGDDAWSILGNILSEQAGSDHALDAVTLLAPLPRPASLRDCLSFERHWIQCARTVVSWKAPPIAWLDRSIEKLTGRSFLRPPKVWRERPIYYKGNPRSVIGTNAKTTWPSYSNKLDFELEVAVYVGKQGSDIAIDQAMEHVAGFSLFNDFTARDVQFREMRGRLGPAKSKDFDTGNVLGPYLVTPDEVELETMKFKVEVNGTVWAEPLADNLQHSVAETIAFLSKSETLYPGDVIGLGTVPNGCGLELDRWLEVGDTVALTATGLGTLTNQVIASCDINM